MIFFAIVILVSFFGLTFHRILPNPDEEETPKDETNMEEVIDETDSHLKEVEKEEKKIRNIFSRIWRKKENEPMEANPFKGPIHISGSYPPDPAQEITNEDDSLETTTVTEPYHIVTKEKPLPKTEEPFKITTTETDSETVVPGENVLMEEEPENPDPLTHELDNEEENDIEVDEENDDFIDEDEEGETPALSDEEANEAYISSLPPIDPRDELIHYQFPTPDLLEAYTSTARSKEEREEEIQNNKVRIKTILSNFGVEIQSISAIEGPTVTMYEIVPAVGVRINRIKNLEDDIALSVAAIGIRIIAPIPGKGSIGIEIPNSVPKIVPMRDTITSDKFVNNTKMALPIAIGRTISNEVFVFDLAKMPHVLMAGATGQGKSVGLNAVLVSLLYHKHPAELKLILVDPKKVELTLYSKIERHYLAKIPGAEA
ncbi:MAG: hypothetical protein J5792_00225, partial [Bacteroidales bacterium]|nr:hypothetical protein [Bacteroidales bacterium]